MSTATIFRQITEALSRAAIPYMLTGAFASNLYGTGGATQHIDLVISATPEQIPEFLHLLSTGDYYFDVESAVEASRRKSMFNILDMAGGWKIDLIFQKPGAYH